MLDDSAAPEQNTQRWLALDQAVEEAWRAHDNAARLTTRVNPSIPILFFGDLSAYSVSTFRVLTVGLNPSLREFPSDRPFSRFPLERWETRRERSSYLDTLSRYFRTDPYRAWFNTWERLLNGGGASFYGGESSAALHTDICSPVATNPTWSRLGDSDRSTLEADGVPLWHQLLDCLKPQVVVISVAERYLQRIKFKPIDNAWSSLHAFHSTGTGEPRTRPYEVRKRWFDVGGAPTLFLFGRAAQMPLGLISAPQKYEMGTNMLEAYWNGR